MSDLPRQKSNFPQNKEVQFSIHFCSILCIKYFLICKIKRYVIMFLHIKIDFWHGNSGPVMAFIPDYISAHVHLLEDNDPIKKTKMAAVSWVFQSGWFSTKTTRVFQREVKTFSSCGAHFRSAITFFLFKLQRQQCACNGQLESLLITRKMHLYRHLSIFLGRLLDFSSVWEGSWIWACGWGNIVWGGVGGGGG